MVDTTPVPTESVFNSYLLIRAFSNQFNQDYKLGDGPIEVKMRSL